MRVCHNKEPAADTELAVLINSYDREFLLREAWASLTAAIRAYGLPVVVCVFDAGSTDGSIEFLHQAILDPGSPPAVILQAGPGDDRSFAAGCAALVDTAHAAAPAIRWLLFFETDNLLTITGPEALEAAVRLLAERPELAAAGFLTELRDGRRTSFGCRVPTVLSFVLGQRLSSRLRLDVPRLSSWRPHLNTRWASAQVMYTSPLLVRHKAWRDTGGMDWRGFPYTDSDVDWCMTAMEMGWKLAVLDVGGVVHDNRGRDSDFSSGRVLRFHQSRLRLLRKHRASGVRFVVPLLLARHLAELGAIALTAPRRSQVGSRLSLRARLLVGALRGYEQSH